MGFWNNDICKAVYRAISTSIAQFAWKPDITTILHNDLSSLSPPDEIILVVFRFVITF
jgi:hypothetical protein